MERLKNGIFISCKEIQMLTGYSEKMARKEHLSIRDALGKKTKRLTVQEYCDYHLLDFAEVVAYINPFR